MGVFRHPLRHLDRKPVQRHVILVAIRSKPLPRGVGSLLPHSHHLHPDHIAHRIIDVMHEIGDAIAILPRLTRQMKPRQLGAAVLIKDHQIIVFPGRLPIAIARLRPQNLLGQAKVKHPPQLRPQLLLGPIEKLLQGPPLFAVTPLELIKTALIHIRHDRARIRLDDARAPKRRYRRGLGKLRPPRPDRPAINRRRGQRLAHRLAPARPALGGGGGDKRRKTAIHHLVHQMQPVERIARISHLPALIGGDAILLDKIAGQRRPAQHHRRGKPQPAHLQQILAHHGGGFDQQPRHPDRIRLVRLNRRQKIRQRHLDAQIDHPVAIVGEDDIDQILADVMHIALHRAEHHRALLLPLDPLHERLQQRHRSLHRLGRSQHKRQLHLARAKQLAHRLHPVEQDIVDDLKRRVALPRQRQILLQSLAVPINNPVAQPLLDLLRPRLAAALRRLAIGKQPQHLGKRIIPLAPAIKDQILRRLHLLRRDQMQRPDLAHMQNRPGHPRLQRMIEKHRIDHRPRRRIEPKAHIGKPQNDLNIREFLTNGADPLQRPKRELAVILIAGGDGEGERIDQKIRLRQPMLPAGKIHQPPRDLQLALRRFGHPLLINGQRNDRRPEFARQQQPLMRRMLAILEIDRIDDRLAAMQLERLLDHRRLGAVDHQRRVHIGGEAGDHLGHLGHLIAAHEGGANIERVRALVHLLAPDGEAPVPILPLLRLAPFLRAIGIATLADREIRILLTQRHRAIKTGHGGHPNGGPLSGGRPRRPKPAQHRIQRLDMRRVGAAAAADQIDPILAHKPLDPARHLGRRQRITRPPIDQLGQPGIGLHRNQPGPVLREIRQMLRHLARPGGAIDPDQRHIKRMDHRAGRRNIRPHQQCPGGLHRHLNKNRRGHPAPGASDLGPIDRRLDLQRILTRLDQDRINPACDQPLGLHAKRRLQRVIADVPERRQLGPRPNPAQHKALPPVAEPIHRLARQLGGFLIDRKSLITHAKFAQGDGRGAKAVGLDHIRAGGEIRAVNVAHQIGA